ncbi:hypothetical protein BJX65DRAFT_304290 [Aspergillus insuetus]
MADLECFPTGSFSGFPSTPGSAVPEDFLEWEGNQEGSTLPWDDVLEPDVSSAEDASCASPSVLVWPEFLRRRIESPVQEGSKGVDVSLGGDCGSFSSARDTNEYTEHCLSPMLAARNFATDNSDPKICLRIANPSPRPNLPDNGRLNVFANLYFTRFNPTMPFLHSTSFQVTRQNCLLFLSVCAIGSQLTGRPQDAQIGRRMFDRVQSAIMASWQKAFLSSSNSKDPFSPIYAGIVCTQFALHSAAPKDLFLAECLHGLVTAGMRAIARRQGMTANKHDIKLALNQGETLEEAWRQWAEAEQRARAYHAMRIHDVELAMLLHHEPMCRHRQFDAPPTATDDVFLAPSAESWAALYREHHHPYEVDPGPMNSSISACSNLHSIRGQLIDARHSHTLDDAAILWHSSYISLYADCDLLERVLCAGGESAQFQPEAHAATTARSWVMSGDARACLLHAAMLQRHAASLSLMLEPALHVSRALFQACLVWLAIWRLTTTRPGPANEAKKKGASKFKDNAKYQVYSVVDQLERLGRLGYSRILLARLRGAIEKE